MTTFSLDPSASSFSEPVRHNWTVPDVEALFAQPFNDLIFQAQQAHRKYFDANRVQVSTLLSIKTGACPEDCKYCPQSGHYNTGLNKEKLMEVRKVLEEARRAKASGATRFCMGAAWKNPPQKDLPYIVEMVKGVKELGLESCMTLGMLNKEQAEVLADAGLDYYNHNLDTSPEFYGSIITTRTFSDRLDTLAHVRDAGMNICSGGIVGMGETERDRAGMLVELANLPKHPESVPINMLVKVAGTPMENTEELDGIDFVRTIAVAKIMMPTSNVRLSAGREKMSDELQALAFLAGANSVFLGDKLLTTPNPEVGRDQQLFKKLGINQNETSEAEQIHEHYCPLKALHEHEKNNDQYFDAMADV